ncbi:hypothetical protein LSH36_934g00014 [Paralvinella palmiformis]|uniref:Phosphoglycolate phosphatase n=1 Tax=Paralvinella palmiformis TaxID=53620 RepID=A0AAD9IX68_9ANNE|nr:hypothetical protein LSH36_934g00014 [Paralvinella palmiformis]
MYCKELTSENIQEFLALFDTVLTDCDGVLWHGSSALPGSPETIQKLHTMGKRIFYITNNSTKSRDDYLIKFTNMGFPATKDSVVGSGYVAAQYVKYQLEYNGKVFVVGSKGIEKELAEADNLDGLSFDDMSKLELDPDINCVIVGLDTQFSYLKLARAISYLAKDGCHFVATNTDTGLPIGSGKVLPEAAAQRKADVICGKPYPLIYETLSQQHRINPDRSLVIGDRLDTDIQLAGRCHLHSLLVLTGFSTLPDVDHLMEHGSEEDKLQIPEYYIKSLEDLGKLITEFQASN